MDWKRKKEIRNWIEADFKKSGTDRKMYTLQGVADAVGCTADDVLVAIPVYSGVGFWFPYDKRPID